MRRILISAALAAFAGAESAPAEAQQVVAVPQPGVVYQQPYTYAGPRDNRAVLPGFAPRGGIGTTPFLGNTRGLGGYSVNYDTVPRSSYTYPGRPRRWFRRNR